MPISIDRIHEVYHTIGLTIVFVYNLDLIISISELPDQEHPARKKPANRVVPNGNGSLF